jgi:hypothetical protein
MPATVFTRPSRDYDFVPGIGSSMTIFQYDGAGTLVLPGVIFDVEDWFVDERPFNKETPHSGGVGAMLRTRTGVDWIWASVLSFPARLVGTEIARGFVQQLLGASRSIAVHFNIGDPEYWASLGDEPARSYRATKTLTNRIQTRADSRTKEVVGLNVAGEGNSLLGLYLNDALQAPNAFS